MRRELMVPVAIGLLLVVATAALVLWLNRGSHLVLDGSVRKVRVLGVEDAACVVVVDFRVANPADYPFVVRQLALILDVDGKEQEGMVVADSDASRLFDFYPQIGPKYNDSLLARQRIESRQTVDRMVTARFELPEMKALTRRGLKVRIEEVDGPVTEIVEKK